MDNDVDDVSLSVCSYKLIRRRVIWLIGQWISVKFKSDLRPLLYEAILGLMQDPDLVVSLTLTYTDTQAHTHTHTHTHTLTLTLTHTHSLRN